MSGAAFADILSDQLPGARVFPEVYYRDPVTNQWSENDTFILIDDPMYLVEAKAGAAATIACDGDVRETKEKWNCGEIDIQSSHLG